MAIYHLHVKVLARAKGHSAIKASAYRAGLRLQDIDGRAVDYSRRNDIIALPIQGIDRSMPDWASDRQSLWQSVEQTEKRKDARLAREIEFALPLEFNKMEQVSCVEEMAGYISRLYQLPVDAVIHLKEGNPHAHLMVPLRSLNADGWGQRLRVMDSKDFVLDVRKKWAEIANTYLVNHNTTIDHRSYEEQGIAKIPQKHLGKKLYKLIKKFILQGYLKIAGQIITDAPPPPAPKLDPPPAEPQRQQQLQNHNHDTVKKPKKIDRGRGGMEL